VKSQLQPISRTLFWILMHSSSLKLKSMIQPLEDVRYTSRSSSLKQVTIRQKERLQPKANQQLRQQERSQSQ
jgi:hypothetical protein